jgi:GDP-mannose 6-dehydrogenase
MNVSIFGLGYVGCVSLGCLAKKGHTIVGVDLNKTKVDFINQGKAPIIEQDIDELISEQHKAGRVSATSDAYEAVANSQVSIICVGTPSTDNGHLDLSAIFKVAKEIGACLKQKQSFHVITIRSTVLPGTNEKVTKILEETSGKERGKSFAVVSNPEFLREGSAVRDYFNPPYTIIGSDNKKAVELIDKLYRDIEAPFIATDIKVAELMKYVNNAFHATKVVFANEIGNICSKIGVDSHKLMSIFCKDTKLNISPYYLKPGFSYGGSCLPKDLKALKTIAHDHYLECPTIESIEKSNENHKRVVLEQILQFGKEKIGFLGVSFKGGTDDLRNSPIVDILEVLLGKGFDVRIFDQNVQIAKLVGANKEYILKKIPFIAKFIVSAEDEIISHSDIIIIVNHDKDFRPLLNRAPKNKIVFDLVNYNFENRSALEHYKGLSW